MRRQLCSLVLFTLVLVSCSHSQHPAPVVRLAGSGDGVHVVRPGETLFSIAFAYGRDTRELAALNALESPYVLQPGQQLKVRGPVPASPDDVQPKPTTTPVASTDETAYGKSDKAAKAQEKQAAGQVDPASSEAEQSVAATDWQWPSRNGLSDTFSTRDDGQQALLFAGDKGDDVLAAAAGQVVYTGSALRSYGRLVIIKHNDDYLTAYGHNQEILVTEQQWVAGGQRIATKGSSGRDNVRLRFELRYRGQAVNPENYLPAR